MSNCKKGEWIINHNFNTIVPTTQEKSKNDEKGQRPEDSENSTQQSSSSVNKINGVLVKCNCDNVVSSLFITLEDKELFRRKERCYGSCSGSGEFGGNPVSIQNNNIKMLLITLTILKLKSEDLSSAPEDGRVSILEKAIKKYPVLFDPP
jgi:hypothetical protein